MSNEEFLRSISLEGEVWKDLEDYNLLFAVSNFGRVVRYEQEIHYLSKNGNPSKRTLKAKIIKPSKFNAKADLMKHGSYLTVTLGSHEDRQRITIHSLVAKMFIPNPNNYPHIDHIDGNRANNNIDNLRWCTAKENMNNPITKERIRESLLDSPEKKRVSVASYKDGKLLRIYPTILATKDDGFRPGCVYNCCKGLKHTHQGLQWKFL